MLKVSLNGRITDFLLHTFQCFQNFQQMSRLFSVVEKCKGMCVCGWVLQEHVRDKNIRLYKKKKVHLS